MGQIANLFEGTYNGSVAVPPDGKRLAFEEKLSLDTWGLIEAGRLVRKIGMELAKELGYENPIGYDERMTEYIGRVRSHSKDATSFYNKTDLL